MYELSLAARRDVVAIVSLIARRAPKPDDLQSVKLLRATGWMAAASLTGHKCRLRVAASAEFCIQPAQ